MRWSESVFWASTPQSFHAAMEAMQPPTKAELRAAKEYQKKRELREWKKDTAPIYEAIARKQAANKNG